MTNHKTPRPTHSFVKSVDANPAGFLQKGETMEQAKQRLLDVTKVIIEKGLSMRDGKLCFGLPEDMEVAKSVYKKYIDGNDMNLMRHANDSLMNAMGDFIGGWSLSLLPPAKPSIPYNPDNPDNPDNPERDLPFIIIKTALENLYQYGFDKAAKPRQFDACNRKIGDGPTGVSAQMSLAGAGISVADDKISGAERHHAGLHKGFVQPQPTTYKPFRPR